MTHVTRCFRPHCPRCQSLDQRDHRLFHLSKTYGVDVARILHLNNQCLFALTNQATTAEAVIAEANRANVILDEWEHFLWSAPHPPKPGIPYSVTRS